MIHHSRMSSHPQALPLLTRINPQATGYSIHNAADNPPAPARKSLPTCYHPACSRAARRCSMIRAT